MADAAAESIGIEALDWQGFAMRAAPSAPPPSAKTDDIAYLQYSSGSTRFPHGVAVTHRALLNNLAAHSHGMEVVDSDRCISWLPWRSEEHTSELQSLMHISYAVFCLKHKHT